MPPGPFRGIMPDGELQGDITRAHDAGRRRRRGGMGTMPKKTETQRQVSVDLAALRALAWQLVGRFGTGGYSR